MKDKVASSTQLMTDFTVSTGLLPARDDPDRYLWTDAFGLCNFLGLYLKTGNREFLDLALRLIGQVHSTLGRYRKDDPRTGWISGLDDRESSLHPTAGGLRIGKKLRERKATEPLDERLEWDRDGQYFHYLTKWMLALDRTAHVTGDPVYNRWAMELARAAHRHFVYSPSPRAEKRMYWKMSTDLSRPLVKSMGLHDPLDGMMTYIQLAATARQMGVEEGLEAETADMEDMCRGRDWATDDPLAIGSLLSDAFRAAHLVIQGYFAGSELVLLLLDASLRSLEAFDVSSTRLPAIHRLAFRELGLSIGLHAIESLDRLAAGNRHLSSGQHFVDKAIGLLRDYEWLSDDIEGFWLQPENQRAPSWMEHRNINIVMLATSILPAGFLGG